MSKSIIVTSKSTDKSLADIAHALIMAKKHNFTVKSVSVVFKEIPDNQANEFCDGIKDILKEAKVEYDVVKVA